MEKYVQEIRIKQWSELIESANNSLLTRKQWLEKNGISKDAFYYWLRKVRKYYAEQNGLIPTTEDSKTMSLVEVPIAHVPKNATTQTTAAIIRVGNMTIEINSEASTEFMENLGRMIRNAL